MLSLSFLVKCRSFGANAKKKHPKACHRTLPPHSSPPPPDHPWPSSIHAGEFTSSDDDDDEAPAPAAGEFVRFLWRRESIETATATFGTVKQYLDTVVRWMFDKDLEMDSTEECRDRAPNSNKTTFTAVIVESF